MSQPLSALEALRRAIQAQSVQQEEIRKEAERIKTQREGERPQGTGASQ